MSHLVEKEFFEYDDEVMDCDNCSSSCYNSCAESCNFSCAAACGGGHNNYY